VKENMSKTIKKYRKVYIILTIALILLIGSTIFFSKTLPSALAEPSVEISGDVYLSQELSASTIGIEGDLTYQWSSSPDGVTFNDIDGATNSTYTITENEVNKYIKVTVTSNEKVFNKVTADVVKIAFYLDKGNITISSTNGYKGYDKNGNAITGTHSDDNKYIVTQTDSNVANSNKLSLEEKINNCDITLAGINTAATDSISIPAYSGSDKNVVLRLKDTNTVNNILYYTSLQKNSTYASTFGTSTLKFTSADGDGSVNGTLNIAPAGTTARWGAGIGGSDNRDAVTGLIIAGGTFNVITDKTDDCTAIGAGGNGYVRMKITGGKIYAENASTGATIGGGLGYDSPGGGGIVEITGGEVEAINHGNNYGVNVWGVAIGGGGSRGGHAADTEVIISGGKIKATVPDGATVIGAGNSTNKYGGKATINISGGDITATGNIGGGSVMGNNTYNGGASTVSVSGGFISVNGNIGGGSATQGNGGASTVNISGGTIVSNSIGGGYSKTNGYNTSNLTITGGSLDSTISSTPTNGKENVYLTPITFYNSNKYLSNSLIKSIKGIDDYGINDVKTDNNGKVYFWIPNASVITGAADTENNAYSGVVQAKSQGVLKYNTSMNFYTVDMVEDSKYYDLYLDKELKNKYTGSIYKTANSTFTFYLDKKIESNGKSYNIDVYASGSDGTMKKINPTSTNSNLEEYKLNISTYNIEVWFVVTDGDQKTLKLNLNTGDIILSKNSSSNNIDVAVGKYSLSNYSGVFTITSLGISTANTVTLVSGKADVLISNLIANGDKSVINVNKGTLTLRSDSYDNQITSTNSPAININDKANIIMENGNSLKITSLTNSAISGKGTITLTKNAGAHLNLYTPDDYSQITANKYTYITNNLNNSTLPYSLTLPNLIGYYNSNDNRLYDLTKTYTVNETTTFKATSLAVTIKDLTETHEIDDNGNLVITFNSQPATLTVLRDGEALNSSSWMSGNTLTIPASEAYNNLSIDATNYYTYNYVTTEYNDFYDGNPHKVNVDITNIENVDVYYSTTILDADNYQTEGSTSSPELTNIGSLPVYFYIPQATYNENLYKEASGVLNINIKKANNRWDLALGIPSIVKGLTLEPWARARWGEPVFTYYKYVDNTYVETTPVEDGTYFVKAFVAGTDNYNDLESDYVIFNIETNALVDAVQGRSLTKITKGPKAIEIPRNGATSAYIAFRYTPNTHEEISFKFSEIIPKHTKVTLIDFNSTTPTYYKYDVDTAVSSLELKDFIKMGTTNTHLNPPTSGGETAAEYQLILDFSETTNNLSNLSSIMYQGTNQLLGTKFDIAFNDKDANSISLRSVTNERGKLSVPIIIKANDTYLKTLDIKVTDDNDNDIMLPIGIKAELLGADGTKYHGFIRKNHIFMTIDKGLIDEEYTLILNNLKTNTYKINAKIYESNNSKASIPNTYEIIERNQDSIYVKDLVLNERFVDNNSSITFNVKYKTESEKEIFIYRSLKENGKYDPKELVGRISVSELSGEQNIPIMINQAPGVWRYYFKIGESTDVYNIIVK